MVSTGAGADDVSKLMATEGQALLRELVQSYFDMCSAQEKRVEVTGADGIDDVTVKHRVGHPVQVDDRCARLTKDPKAIASISEVALAILERALALLTHIVGERRATDDVLLPLQVVIEHLEYMGRLAAL